MSNHIYVFEENLDTCQICRNEFSECMKWVQIWIMKSFSESAMRNGNPLDRVGLIESDVSHSMRLVKADSNKNNTFLLTTNGTVYTWGMSMNSVNSDPMISRRVDFMYPSLMEDLLGVNIVYLSCGEEHVLAIDEGKYVWSWGSNDRDQLGRPGKSGDYIGPERIEYINQVVRVAAGGYTSFAVNQNGVVFGWGELFTSEHLDGFRGKKETKQIPTEIIDQPWIVSKTQGKSKKPFQSSGRRDLMIGNKSLEDIKKLEVENEELGYLYDYLTSKVNILEDINNKRGSLKLKDEKWRNDDCLKKINELKKELRSRKTEEKKRETKYSESKKKVEAEQTEVNKEISQKKVERGKLFDLDSEDISNQRQHRIIKISKEIDELEGRAEKLKKQQIKIDSQLKNTDPSPFKSENLAMMKVCRKKFIADKFFLQFEKKSLYRDIKNIIKIQKILDEITPEALLKIVHPDTLPSTIIKYSNCILEFFKSQINNRIELTGSESEEAIKEMYQVLLSNIKLQIDINVTSKIISASANLEIFKLSGHLQTPSVLSYNEERIHEIVKKAKFDDEFVLAIKIKNQNT